MKKFFLTSLTMLLLATMTVDAASVRKRFVPRNDIEWGAAPAIIEAMPVEPRQVSFIHYGGVIEIKSDFKIGRVDVYSVSGTLLSSRKINGYQANLNAGDFDAGLYIVVTRFADGGTPAVNKFVR